MGNQVLTEEERRQIEGRIQALELEHHDLDDIIARLQADPRVKSIEPDARVSIQAAPANDPFASPTGILPGS